MIGLSRYTRPLTRFMASAEKLQCPLTAFARSRLTGHISLRRPRLQYSTVACSNTPEACRTFRVHLFQEPIKGECKGYNKTFDSEDYESSTKCIEKVLDYLRKNFKSDEEMGVFRAFFAGTSDHMKFAFKSKGSFHHLLILPNIIPVPIKSLEPLTASRKRVLRETSDVGDKIRKEFFTHERAVKENDRMLIAFFHSKLFLEVSVSWPNSHKKTYSEAPKERVIEPDIR